MQRARKEKECVELAKSLGTTINRAIAIIGGKGSKALQRTTIGCGADNQCAEKKKKESLVQVQIKVNEKLAETCVVYEGQTAEQVAEELAQKHKLSSETKLKIKKGIQAQLDAIGASVGTKSSIEGGKTKL